MTKKELEKLVKDLEKRVKHLENPLGDHTPDFFPDYGGRARTTFEPECLHNGCGHDRGVRACMLYCPHCSPIC